MAAASKGSGGGGGLAERTLSDALAAYLWIGVWVCLSVSIILVNKHVMFYSGFRFPFTLALWHMFLATVTARTAVWALGLPDTIKQHRSSSLYGQVALIGTLFGGTLVAGNAALLFLTVPTIQMLKASIPSVVYCVSIAMGNEKPSLLQTVKVLIVCTGVAVAGYGDVSFNLVGLCLQLASAAMDAVRCCTLQRVLQANAIQVGPLVTLAHVAPFTMAALILPVAFFEGPRLLSSYAEWRGAIPMVVLSGALASLLNLVVFKLIGLTSALTTSLTGVFKDWACIVLAMYMYGNVVSSTQWLGYGIALTGLFWYHYGKLTQARAAAAPAASASLLGGGEREDDAEEGTALLLPASKLQGALMPGAGGKSWDEQQQQQQHHAGGGTVSSRVSAGSGGGVLRVKS